MNNKTTIRLPEHLKQVFQKYAKLRGSSLNKLIVDTLTEQILMDNKLASNMGELDLDVLNERLRESEITKLKYLRTRNCAELYEIPQIVLELKKFLSKKYISREPINDNFDLSCELIRKYPNAESLFKELLKACTSLNEEYKWDYGERKCRVELLKLQTLKPKIEA